MNNTKDVVSATTIKQADIKQEIANKNAIVLGTTDADAVGSRLKALDALGDAIKQALVKGIDNDYAVIPNTKKPCLLAPGANKICMLYGLVAQFPYFEEDEKRKLIKVRCELYSNGMKVSESYGACSIGNSRDYGWEYNKALKMAQIRAKKGAVLNIGNLSKVFTQDMEDAPENAVSVRNNEGSKQRAYELHNKYAKKLNKRPGKATWKAFCKDVANWTNTKKGQKLNPYQLVENGFDKEYGEDTFDEGLFAESDVEIKE